jgi:hypothetical protein
MANTLTAPGAEPTVNYKSSAITCAIVATIWFALDVRAQKQDLREAAAARDELRLRDILRDPEPGCIHAHCLERDHVYHPEAS